MSARKIAIPVKVYWEKVGTPDEVRDVTDHSCYHKPGQVIDASDVTVSGKPWLVSQRCGRKKIKLREVASLSGTKQNMQTCADVSSASGSQRVTMDANPVTLKDLCQQDKRKVANLIQELAKYGQEKENAIDQLHQAKLDFEKKLQHLFSEKENAIKEQDRLKGKLAKYQLSMGSQLRAGELPDKSSLDLGSTHTQGTPDAVLADVSDLCDSFANEPPFSTCDPNTATYYYLGRAEPIHVHALKKTKVENLEADAYKNDQVSSGTRGTDVKQLGSAAENVENQGDSIYSDDMLKVTLLEQQLKLQTQQRHLQQQIEQLQLLQESMLKNNSNSAKPLLSRPSPSAREKASEAATKNVFTENDDPLQFSSAALISSLKVSEAHKPETDDVYAAKSPKLSVLGITCKDAVCQVGDRSPGDQLALPAIEKHFVSRTTSMEDDVPKCSNLHEPHFKPLSVRDHENRSAKLQLPISFPFQANSHGCEDVALGEQFAAGKSCSMASERFCMEKSIGKFISDMPSGLHDGQPSISIESDLALLDFDSVTSSCHTSALARRHFKPSSILELVEGMHPKSASTSLRSSYKSQSTEWNNPHIVGRPYLQTVTRHIRTESSSKQSRKSGKFSRTMSKIKPGAILAKEAKPSFCDDFHSVIESPENRLIEDVFFL